MTTTRLNDKEAELHDLVREQVSEPVSYIDRGNDVPAHEVRVRCRHATPPSRSLGPGHARTATPVCTSRAGCTSHAASCTSHRGVR